MTADDLDKGMVVVLKSGRPPMTVRVVLGNTAYCEWFTALDRRQGTFNVESLARADAASGSDAQST